MTVSCWLQALLVHWVVQMERNKHPILHSLPTHLCPAGMWGKRKRWTLICLSQQLYWITKLFLLAVSKKYIVPACCDWGALCKDSLSLFFLNHFIVNGVFSECSYIQWLKCYYIVKCNYWLDFFPTKYLSSALYFLHSLFLCLLSEVSKEARFVNRCTIAL